jgi:secreted trypsin-like serine protease
MIRKAMFLALILAVLGPAGAHAASVVVGGDVAPDGSFPWMVRLSMGCGGTLIGPRAVLTAAHCVSGSGPQKSITVTAGSADLKSKRALTAHSVSVTRAPGFVKETRGDDWAVIKLDRALQLPIIELTSANSAKGSYTIMGWGLTGEGSEDQQRRLRYATVVTVPDGSCAAAYRRVNVNLVEGESICAGRNGVDTCQGDSGGPMVGRDAKGRWVQVGIVSWGLGCARDGYPGVYSQVSAFRSAIRKAASSF